MQGRHYLATRRRPVNDFAGGTLNKKEGRCK
jgi:hypothetical protein